MDINQRLVKIFDTFIIQVRKHSKLIDDQLIKYTCQQGLLEIARTSKVNIIISFLLILFNCVYCGDALSWNYRMSALYLARAHQSSLLGTNETIIGLVYL